MSEKTSGEDSGAQRLLSGRAWEDYCEVLKTAGRAIERWKITARERRLTI